MSIITQGASVCSKCGKEHTVKIYKSINVAQDPELKTKVLDGSLFLWECPDCGTSNLVAYDCLYHDPEEKIMVWMLPFGEPEGAEKTAIMNQARAMGEYRLRIVKNAGDLMEKLIIFESGLDDRCMELVKYVAGKEMPGVSRLHFYRMQDDAMVFSGMRTSPEHPQGVMEGFGIGLNVYEDCQGILTRNPDIASGEGFCIVDAAWVDSILS